ncbi:peptidyl-prolyl cis-trans isomerase [Ruegeria atlantica]|uniref:peptidylprolyl isomerase n=1 Tax=Ruegeria atlantica TaxID=81569 RepID=UPI00147C3B27|nr:peptidylprolyl isomerase [Ruegeria atlantica]
MRFLKEPLFHFILIGAAIFGWFALVSPNKESGAPPEVIVFDNNDVDLLIARFETTWKRPPNSDELQALIDGAVREEVLVREARKLGLDRGDQVIRARLAQKMDFLADAIASAVEPEDSILEAYIVANPARFATPPRLAFEQIYLGETPEPDEVEAAISKLKAGEDWVTVGVPSLMPKAMPLTAPKAIDATFGPGFHSGLEPLEVGVWVGPVRSGYGLHMVRVTETREGSLPPLADIREAVVLAWRRDTAEDLSLAQYEHLAGQYRIEKPVFGE